MEDGKLAQDFLDSLQCLQHPALQRGRQRSEAPLRGAAGFRARHRAFPGPRRDFQAEEL